MRFVRDVVAFDMDGVLVDSQALILESLDHALSVIGRGPVTESWRREVVGPPLRRMLEMVLGDSADPDEYDACVTAYREHNDLFGPVRTPVFPGMTEVLFELGRHVELIVVTSKREPSAEAILSGTGLRSSFNAVFGSLSDASPETKSVTLARALQQFPRARVLIGDREHDAVAAFEHCLCPIGVRWGYARQGELENAGVAHIAANSADLLELVLQQL